MVLINLYLIRVIPATWSASARIWLLMEASYYTTASDLVPTGYHVEHNLVVKMEQEWKKSANVQQCLVAASGPVRRSSHGGWVCAWEIILIGTTARSPGIAVGDSGRNSSHFIGRTRELSVLESDARVRRYWPDHGDRLLSLGI